MFSINRVLFRLYRYVESNIFFREKSHIIGDKGRFSSHYNLFAISRTKKKSHTAFAMTNSANASEIECMSREGQLFLMILQTGYNGIILYINWNTVFS